MEYNRDYYRGRYHYLKKIVHELQKQDYDKSLNVLDRIREEDNPHDLIENKTTIYIVRG